MLAFHSSFVSPPSSFRAEVSALFWKDVRAELRTKTALSSMGIFAFAALLLIALATVTLSSAFQVDIAALQFPVASRANIDVHLIPAWDNLSKMGLLWVLLFFAAFAGLAHSFVHEEEAGTSLALRLAMSPGAVYTGKLAFNLSALAMVACLVTPAYMTITGMSAGRPLVLLSVMVGGCMGLAGTATVLAAISARARGTGALYGALGLPVLLVFLMLLLNAAKALYGGAATTVQLFQAVGGLFSFDVLLVTVSALIFPFVWED